MWRKLAALWRGWDSTLFALTVSLVVIGLAALYSSSLSRPESAGLFWRQLAAVLLGLVVIVLVSAIDYQQYRSWSRLLYVAAVVLLVLVLILGRTIRGATGWFRFGTLGFQPVEIVKYLWLVSLASYLVTCRSALDLAQDRGRDAHAVAAVRFGYSPA